MLRKRLIHVSVFSLFTGIALFVAAGMLLSKYYEDAAGPINICVLLGVLGFALSLVTGIAAFVVRR